jgi:hypothetical protein
LEEELEDKPIFHMPKNVKTRWASAENWDAEPGASAKANFGRKGSACKVNFAPGESFTMAHAEGTSGIVRRMWVTISERTPELLRGIVLRMYWDGAEKPAVEVPLGDFFCQPLGRLVAFQNAWFDNPEGRSFNCRIPMPFRTGFKITATNESDKNLTMFFYDVNFTIGDEIGEDVNYFHAHYRHENPTTRRQDFEILPKITGKGRFLGASFGVIADTEKYGKMWWGEGEVKMYLDGDTDYPTLCGTGTEDYIATGWGQGQYAYMWHGCPLADHENYQYGFYRLHGPDPVYFYEEIRVTIQQIGCPNEEMAIAALEKGVELIVLGDGTKKMTIEGIKDKSTWSCFEREDDWSSVAYFYFDKPVSELPAIEPYEARIAGVTGDIDAPKRQDPTL